MTLRNPIASRGHIVLTLITLAIASMALMLTRIHQVDINTIDSELASLKQSLTDSTRPAVINMESTLPPVNAPKQLTLAERLALGTPHKGQGFEHSMIRQLRADPTKFNSTKFKFTGDFAQTAAVKTWAGRVAHIIAIEDGKFDIKFHSSVGPRRPDEVSYLLDVDSNGNVTVAEYVTPKPGQGFGSDPQPQHVGRLANSISQAQFAGWPDNLQHHSLPVYEYLQLNRG
jgi:hypothetical protein